MVYNTKIAFILNIFNSTHMAIIFDILDELNYKES